MLRLRDINGEEVPCSARFVELCDLDGQVAAVIYADARGVTHFHQAGSPEHARYLSLFGLSGAKLLATPDKTPTV